MTTITIRRPTFDLDDLPVDWIAGRRLATHFGNAGHVFIPLGEQFFIDTVRMFRDRIEDPDLRRQVNAFLGQEAVHKRAHEQVWGLLRAWGLPVDRYASVIGQIRSLEDHLPETFRLSVTAALEHYTAAFGHSFLTEDLSDAVPEEMARLLAWHGLEEIEHRSVAFDVLATVDDSYLTRLAGFAFASALFVAVPAAGTAMFAAADRGRRVRLDPVAGVRLAGMTARFVGRAGAHLAGYLRPGFHPRQMQPPPEAAEIDRTLAAS